MQLLQTELSDSKQKVDQLESELFDSKQKIDQLESQMIKLQENNRTLEVSVQVSEHLGCMMHLATNAHYNNVII